MSRDRVGDWTQGARGRLTVTVEGASRYLGYHLVDEWHGSRFSGRICP